MTLGIMPYTSLQKNISFHYLTKKIMGSSNLLFLLLFMICITYINMSNGHFPSQLSTLHMEPYSVSSVVIMCMIKNWQL